MSSYPAVPGERIAYDADGTVVWKTQSQGGGSFGGGGRFEAMIVPPGELSTSDKEEINDEDTVPVLVNGGPAAVDHGWAWIWPEKRDMFGFYGWATGNAYASIAEIYSSTDSRNGITGDFLVNAVKSGGTDFFSTSDGYEPLVQPYGNNYWSVGQSYREFIHAYSSTGATCVRVRVQTSKVVGAAVDSTYVAAFHWYGSIADAANPDRLQFIDDDTGLPYTSVQDWGDKPRGTISDKNIYLYNNSATLSASSNVITFESLQGNSSGWYSIKDNSSTAPAFTPSLTIDGPIGAGTRYPSTTTLTVRQTLPSTDHLGPRATRLKLFTGVWA